MRKTTWAHACCSKEFASTTSRIIPTTANSMWRLSPRSEIPSKHSCFDASRLLLSRLLSQGRLGGLPKSVEKSPDAARKSLCATPYGTVNVADLLTPAVEPVIVTVCVALLCV